MPIDESRFYVRSFAPGRTELAGNHTDHQGGRVIAATLDCGMQMRVQPNGLDVVRVASQGFDPFQIDLAALEPRSDEVHSTAGLVRGMVAGLDDAGVCIAGFDVEVASDIPSGGGLSSSAAFELALGQALNVLYADGRVDALALARIAQRAERSWFGKPCGLMDQLSIALGGINVLDFAAGECSSSRIDCSLDEAGLALAIIDTGSDHAAFSDEYAQVADDMAAVAGFLGVDELSRLTPDAYLERLCEVRLALGDRAALRALHFFNEMRLVSEREDALRAGDAGRFVEATRLSGISSAQYLQNVSVPGCDEQPAMVALALAQLFAGRGGAARIHGGGFGGTVQAFVPLDDADAFICKINRQLGEGACKRFHITGKGAYAQAVT